MLFWTIVFFTFAIIKLIKGDVFHQTTINMAEITVKLANPDLTKRETDDLNGEMMKSGMWYLLTFGLGMVVAEIIYLLNAVKLDTFEYPTVIMICLVIFIVVRNYVTKKPDISTEQNQKIYLAKVYASKRTFFSTFNSLANLSYFGYMFYNLLLRQKGEIKIEYNNY